MARILVVEDEAHISGLLKLWLERHGHAVVQASDGRSALTVLDAQAVDFIVSDMNMPELDGLGLVKEVRDTRGIDVPIVLLSARCDQTKLQGLLGPYKVRLYPKPFMPSRLVSEIDELLKSRMEAAQPDVATASGQDG